MSDDYAKVKKLADDNANASALIRGIDLSLYKDFPSVGVLHTAVLAEQAKIEPLLKPWAKLAAKRDGGGRPTDAEWKRVRDLGTPLMRHAQLSDAMLREMKRARRTVEKRERAN